MWSVLFRRESDSEREARIYEVVIMKKKYDFSKSVKNPYLKKAKKQVTIRLDE